MLARLSTPPPTVLMSAVGLPWLKSIMPSSRMLPLLLILPYFISVSRWFHFKVCMVAGVGFFTDAYVRNLCPFLSQPNGISATIFSPSTSLRRCWATYTGQVSLHRPSFLGSFTHIRLRGHIELFTKSRHQSSHSRGHSLWSTSFRMACRPRWTQAHV